MAVYLVPHTVYFCTLFHKPFWVRPAVAHLLGRQGILQTYSIVCFTNSGRSLWKTWIESLLQCKQTRAASSLYSQIWPSTVDIQVEQVRDQRGSFKDAYIDKHTHYYSSERFQETPKK